MSTADDMLSHDLGYMLKLTQHVLRIRMDEDLRSLNLTTPQYSVLSQVEKNPGISSAALARESFVTAQTMQGIVSNLEKRDLLIRKSDENHGRILRAELTKQGLKLVRQAHDMIAKVQDHMTQSMSKKDKSTLEKLLIECINNLRDSE